MGTSGAPLGTSGAPLATFGAPLATLGRPSGVSCAPLAPCWRHPGDPLAAGGHPGRAGRGSAASTRRAAAAAEHSAQAARGGGRIRPRRRAATAIRATSCNLRRLAPLLSLPSRSMQLLNHVCLRVPTALLCFFVRPSLHAESGVLHGTHPIGLPRYAKDEAPLSLVRYRCSAQTNHCIEVAECFVVDPRSAERPERNRERGCIGLSESELTARL